MSENIPEIEGSWELVVALKYQAYYLRASHYIAESIVKYGGDSASKIFIIEVAMDVYRMLLATASEDRTSEYYVQRSVFRNAGVVAGMLGGQYQQAGDNEGSKSTAVTMFRFWDRFMDQCELEAGNEERDCKEVSLFLDHGVNPYTQQNFAGEAGFAWVGEKYKGTHAKKYQ